MRKTPIDKFVEATRFAKMLARRKLYWLFLHYWRLVLMPRMNAAWKYINGEEYEQH